MTQHSSIQTESPAEQTVSATDSAEISPPEVPLSERPLVADGQNTVVSSGTENSSTNLAVASSEAGQNMVARLFPGNTSDQGSLASDVQIAHFRVHERIGSGGMGAVFRATDIELAREVALKVLHPSIAGDPALISRFRNEARACARLNHDNIARVYYTGQQDGVYFIAYEFADGKTIKDLIQEQGTLPSSATVNYAIQATLALNHIFAAGIVHRDIKPSNIILTESGRIKIVDLGLARRDSTDSVGDITVAGTTLGTFDYISPEQARDPRSADTRSDVYSLGCTMYHMLTGQPPYPEGTALQKLLDHQGKSPPNAAQLNKKVQPELAAVIQKMMSTQPEDRYQNPGQLLADLMDLAALMGLRSIPAEGIVWERNEKPTAKNSIGSAFLFASILVMSIAAVVIHMTPPADSPAEMLTAVDTSNTQTSEETDSEDTESVPSETSTDSINATTTQSANGDSVPVPGSHGADSTDNSSSATVSTDTSEQNTTQTAVVAAEPFELRSSEGETKQYKRTLSAALSDSEPGDIIRLRFNGTALAPLRDLSRLSGRSIKLQASEGYSPVLEFQGDDDSGTPGSMFELVNNSSLTIEGIGLRLNPQLDVTAEDWSVFDCTGPNQVVLKDVSIEVSNPGQFSAAVFRLRDSRIPEDGAINTECRLSGVAVRGPADLFHIQGQTVGTLELDNCGLALEGSLINNTGSASMQHAAGNLFVSLNRTTCLMGSPLVRMQDSETIPDTGPERTLPVIHLNSSACVFASINGPGTVVLSRGNAYLDDLQDLFVWRGNTNLFHDYDWFWYLESGEADFTSRTMSLDEWNEFWTKLGTGTDDQTIEFEWPSPRWLSTDGSVNVAAMDDQWFWIEQSLFRGSDPSLPLFEGREIPGVAVGSLPQFEQLETTSTSSDDADE